MGAIKNLVDFIEVADSVKPEHFAKVVYSSDSIPKVNGYDDYVDAVVEKLVSEYAKAGFHVRERDILDLIVNYIPTYEMFIQNALYDADYDFDERLVSPW